VEGDLLYGRGTTDCLGHVALITELMLQLALTKPSLRNTVTAVFIANEENGLVENIGVVRCLRIEPTLADHQARSHGTPYFERHVRTLSIPHQHARAPPEWPSTSLRGQDQLMKTGKIDHLKSGPIFWIDCADINPCIGTCGSLTWTLKATGKLFHSGLPHKGVK
jgi:acetylornithine deacetylase